MEKHSKIVYFTIAISIVFYIASDVLYAESYNSTETSIQTGKTFRGKRRKKRRVPPRQRPAPHNHNAPDKGEQRQGQADDHNHAQNPMPSVPHECRVEPFPYKVEDSSGINQIETPKGKFTFSIDESGILKFSDIAPLQPYIGESAKTICLHFNEQKKQGKLLTENINKFLLACQSLAFTSEAKPEQNLTPHTSVVPQISLPPSIEQHATPAPSTEKPRFILPPAPGSTSPKKDDCCPDDKPKAKPKKDQCCDHDH